MSQERLTSWLARLIRASGVVAIALWMVLPGCGSSECTRGAERCNGYQVQRCYLPCAEFGCGNEWTDGEVCRAAGACMEFDENTALCVLSTAPDPRCNGNVGYCDGDVSVDCYRGYRRSEVDCSLDPNAPAIAAGAGSPSAGPSDASFDVGPRDAEAVDSGRASSDAAVSTASRGGHCVVASDSRPFCQYPSR